MTTMELDDALLEEAEYLLQVRELRLRKAREHPAFFLHWVECIDAKTGEEFKFDLLDEVEREMIGDPGMPSGWFWHREILDSWLDNTLSLELKARQIGITWLAAGLGLWTVMMRPGTRVLILSTNEEEAKKVIARIWSMYKSLPEWMRAHLAVTKPARGGDPSQEIEFTDAAGKKSTIVALPATAKAGHGETAALVILDEFARQDFAQDIWKGTFPVIDGGGRVIVISTANGVSNELTGDGNFFHYLWCNAATMGILARFLAWNRHPDRDEQWYTERAAALPPKDRAEQYPRTPEDAFINTGQCWFDLDKLNAYMNRWRASGREILYRMKFVEEIRQARKVVHSQGEWRVYVEPKKGGSYAIAADVATGRGSDFSAAHVIDLSTAEFVAEYHGRVEPDVYAMHLYYAGRWYNDALIAVESQGGYGESVIIPLRDGIKGRKPYRRLYRHGVKETSVDAKERSTFGYPMNTATRPTVINQMEQWIREETLPWITPELDAELRTFSVAKSNPSPRAQDGCNDDRVMSACVALEMYRQYGRHERKRRPRGRSRWKDTMHPWEER